MVIGAARDNPPDAILSWYLLPYGVAAYVSSQILGKRYAVQHAGSDITRLFNDPYLLHCYFKGT